MTAQVLFFNDFPEKDPQSIALEIPLKLTCKTIFQNNIELAFSLIYSLYAINNLRLRYV